MGQTGSNCSLLLPAGELARSSAVGRSERKTKVVLHCQCAFNLRNPSLQYIGMLKDAVDALDAATDSDWIISWMNSLSILFLARKCLSPECRLLRVCCKNLLPLCSGIRGQRGDRGPVSLQALPVQPSV